jgi:hypothetical protein
MGLFFDVGYKPSYYHGLDMRDVYPLFSKAFPRTLARPKAYLPNPIMKDSKGLTTVTFRCANVTYLWIKNPAFHVSLSYFNVRNLDRVAFSTQASHNIAALSVRTLDNVA